MDAAASLLASLIAHGVRDIVVSPGSRSQALALAATHFARQWSLRVHVRIDERVAGFTALGIAREQRVPVAVICTSGTAVANLLPAAMEAFHAGVPLLLLTADRPPELRGVGANQATVQPGLFEPFARLSIDAPVPGDDHGFDWAALGERAISVALGAIDTPGSPVRTNTTAPASDLDRSPALTADLGKTPALTSDLDGSPAPDLDGSPASDLDGSPAPDLDRSPALPTLAADRRPTTAPALEGVAGPVHLNLPSREPLSAAL
ncbi:MAG TPA: thiamine pyrophosphate-binding protein, partial [Microbacterium sp.]|nr:thiamine pyrophosphate-binding protein [Microbacterium sp.]